MSRDEVPYVTTNAARIRGVNLCDFLTLMNNRLLNLTSSDVCLIDLLVPSKEQRRLGCANYGGCSECLQKFLNDRSEPNVEL